MNAFNGLIKIAAITFVIGFLIHNGPSLAGELLPLAGLAILVSTVLVLFELTNVEPVGVPSAVRAAGGQNGGSS